MAEETPKTSPQSMEDYEYDRQVKVIEKCMAEVEQVLRKHGVIQYADCRAFPDKRRRGALYLRGSISYTIQQDPAENDGAPQG